VGKLRMVGVRTSELVLVAIPWLLTLIGVIEEGSEGYRFPMGVEVTVAPIDDDETIKALGGTGLGINPSCCIRSWRTRILDEGWFALALVNSRDSGDNIEFVGDSMLDDTRGILNIVEDDGVGVSLPEDGVGEGMTGLGISVGRLANTSSPGTWVSVGAGGASRLGRVLADRSAVNCLPSYAVIRFWTDFR
jgi:hypothetical protein